MRLQSVEFRTRVGFPNGVGTGKTLQTVVIVGNPQFKGWSVDTDATKRLLRVTHPSWPSPVFVPYENVLAFTPAPEPKVSAETDAASAAPKKTKRRRSGS